MKIAQYYEKDRIRLGLVKDETINPLDFKGDMLDFLNRDQICNISVNQVPVDDVHFAPPVSRPSKIIAIGLNYKDHITESRGKIPEAPVVFAKFPNSLLGHKEIIKWDPSLTDRVDFEAELALIIGKKIHNCTEEKAMEAVFGFTCGNDVSARDIQFKDKQWVRGKSFDTFCPIGPWVVTLNEFDDPYSLNIRSILNGVVMQESNTRMMIFKLPQLISFLSKNFTLYPGDIIMTGTPQGVGAFRDPPLYMKDGDEIIIEIEGIGRLVNRCGTRSI